MGPQDGGRCRQVVVNSGLTTCEIKDFTFSSGKSCMQENLAREKKIRVIIICKKLDRIKTKNMLICN